MMGRDAVTARGMKWGTSQSSLNQIVNATGAFSVNLTGLTPGQTVWYKAFATNVNDIERWMASIRNDQKYLYFYKFEIRER